MVLAKLSGLKEIEIWGDGSQTRTFTYISDCVDGTLLVASGDNPEPVNIGRAELVSINELVDLVEQIAEVKLQRRYVPTAPNSASCLRPPVGLDPSPNRHCLS